MTSDQADIFLAFCTNAMQAKAETPALSIVSSGKTLNVGADYGLIALRSGPAAQAILLHHGFGPGNPPQ
jgi:molybdate transport system substrate-binding protein